MRNESESRVQYQSPVWPLSFSPSAKHSSFCLFHSLNSPHAKPELCPDPIGIPPQTQHNPTRLHLMVCTRSHKFHRPLTTAIYRIQTGSKTTPKTIYVNRDLVLIYEPLRCIDQSRCDAPMPLNIEERPGNKYGAPVLFILLPFIFVLSVLSFILACPPGFLSLFLYFFPSFLFILYFSCYFHPLILFRYSCLVHEFTLEAGLPLKQQRKPPHPYVNLHSSMCFCGFLTCLRLSMSPRHLAWYKMFALETPAK
jgi:hypothetical protein